jgi:hypothetical protein
MRARRLFIASRLLCCTHRDCSQASEKMMSLKQTSREYLKRFQNSRWVDKKLTGKSHGKATNPKGSDRLPDRKDH